MTTDEIRMLAYRVYDAINAKDATSLENLFDPHVIRHAAGEIGIESVRKALVNAFATSPEKRFVVEDTVVEGNKVALRVAVHGVAAAPGDHLPTILEIFRVEGGKVAEVWGAGSMRR